MIALVSSCKSIDKMVEKGQYEEAYYYAISKLAGTKNKKTAHVQGLETAFIKLNERDLNDIERMNVEKRPDLYPKVHSIYVKMDKRQNAIKALLPLKSKDGYTARFDLVNYNEVLNALAESSAAYYYNNALNLIERSDRNKDKNLAKLAYNDLLNIESYFRNYKDKEALKLRALDLGKSVVYVDIINNLSGSLGKEADRKLWNMAIGQLNNTWYEFTNDPSAKVNEADIIVALDLHNLDLSPERELVHTFNEQKEILVKTEKILTMKDSIPVETIKEHYLLVTAFLTEIRREKSGILNGEIRFYDNSTKNYFRTVPVNVHFNFADTGLNFTGDERALSNETKSRLDYHLAYFPYDLDIVNDLTSKFSQIAMREMKYVRG